MNNTEDFNGDWYHSKYYPKLHHNMIMDWIKYFIKPIKTVNSNRGNYGLKHDCERDINDYVHPDEFKSCMVESGFEPSDSTYRDCYKISEKPFTRSKIIHERSLKLYYPFNDYKGTKNVRLFYGAQKALRNLINLKENEVKEVSECDLNIR